MLPHSTGVLLGPPPPLPLPMSSALHGFLLSLASSFCAGPPVRLRPGPGFPQSDCVLHPRGPAPQPCSDDPLVSHASTTRHHRLTRRSWRPQALQQGASGAGSPWRLREKPAGLSCFWRCLHFSARGLVLQSSILTARSVSGLHLSVLCFCPHVFSDTEPPPPLYKDLVIRLGSTDNPGSSPLSRS